ncbi:hypothetical protein [Ekhidna sp. To15]|uniref:hypothetical protein n=1 Tax=Ekhidna sp. To15 TaxID=3395267 RepID=UPI003F51D804
MNNKKSCVILVAIFTSAISLYGQARFSGSSEAYGTGGVTYLNKSTTSLGEDATKRGYYVGPHVLGDTITMLLNRFENDFVYYEMGTGAYAVEEKKVIKPSLHKAIWRVNKYYEKKVDAGDITERNAYIRMKAVVSKGIKLKNYYTEDIEAKLKKMKKAPEIEAYLDKIKFR